MKLFAGLSIATTVVNGDCTFPESDTGLLRFTGCKNANDLPTPAKFWIRKTADLAEQSNTVPDDTYCNKVSCARPNINALQLDDKQKVACIGGEWKVAHVSKSKGEAVIEVVGDVTWPTCPLGCTRTPGSALKRWTEHKNPKQAARTMVINSNGTNYYSPGSKATVTCNCNSGVDFSDGTWPQCNTGDDVYALTSDQVCTCDGNDCHYIAKNSYEVYRAWGATEMSWIAADTMRCSTTEESWSEWSECPQVGGVQERTRTCTGKDADNNTVPLPLMDCGVTDTSEFRRCGTPLKWKKKYEISASTFGPYHNDNGLGAGADWSWSINKYGVPHEKSDKIRAGFDSLSMHTSPRCDEVDGFYEKLGTWHGQCHSWVVTKEKENNFFKFYIQQDFTVTAVALDKAALEYRLGHPDMFWNMEVFVSEKDNSNYNYDGNFPGVSCGRAVETIGRVDPRELTLVPQLTWRCPENTFGTYVWITQPKGSTLPVGFEEAFIYAGITIPPTEAPVTQPADPNVDWAAAHELDIAAEGAGDANFGGVDCGVEGVDYKVNGDGTWSVAVGTECIYTCKNVKYRAAQQLASVTSGSSDEPNWLFQHVPGHSAGVNYSPGYNGNAPFSALGTVCLKIAGQSATGNTCVPPAAKFNVDSWSCTDGNQPGSKCTPVCAALHKTNEHPDYSHVYCVCGKTCKWERYYQQNDGAWALGSAVKCRVTNCKRPTAGKGGDNFWSNVEAFETKCFDKDGNVLTTATGPNDTSKDAIWPEGSICYPTKCPENTILTHVDSENAEVQYDTEELSDCRCPYDESGSSFFCKWKGEDKMHINVCRVLSAFEPIPEYEDGCWAMSVHQLEEAGVENFDGVKCDQEPQANGIYKDGTICIPNCIAGYVLEETDSWSGKWGKCYFHTHNDMYYHEWDGFYWNDYSEWEGWFPSCIQEGKGRKRRSRELSTDT